jgi:HAD superfamily hydrolase (TIGR01450 family)
VSLADQFDGFLVDLDGVVWVGRDPVPGSPEALASLLGAGVEIVFVTNNPTKLPSAYAERLSGMGVEVGPDRIVTAGMVAARLAGEAAADGSALVLGREPLREMVAAAGPELLDGDDVEGADSAAVVVVSGFPEFRFDHLRAAKRALDAGAALVATSRDPTMPMPGGEWPGTGSILAAIETATGRTAEIAGKPERHLFEMALAAIPGAERVAMIGDRLSSDIAGGHAAGLATILVLSGTSGSGRGSEDLSKADPAPDHVLPNLAALLD